MGIHNCLNVFAAAAGGGGTPHRYWRINQTTNHGHATATRIAEVEFRDAPGGTDLTGAGTASAGGGFTSSTPANAFDNDTTTAYVPAGTSGWLKYDFGSAVDVQEVAIMGEVSSGSPDFTAQPKDFTIEWSDDDTNWNVFDTCQAFGWLMGLYQVFPAPAPPAAGFHRFWRVMCLTANGGTFYLVAEAEFRATAGGADQVPVQSGGNGGATGRAIMTTGDSAAWQAFDNNSGTTWNSSGTANRFFGFIFDVAVKLEEISMTVTANTVRTPSTMQVEYSDDGISWTNQKSLGPMTWTASETKVMAAI